MGTDSGPDAASSIIADGDLTKNPQFEIVVIPIELAHNRAAHLCWSLAVASNAAANAIEPVLSSQAICCSRILSRPSILRLSWLI